MRRRGIEAWSAVEAGNLGLSDEEQLECAVEEQAVLFTHDTDFISISKKWINAGIGHWGVIYMHQDSLSIGQCIYRLKDYADLLETEEMKNRLEFL